MTGDDFWIRQCLSLARDAAAQDEVPIGAVVVRDGEIIGRGRNRREETGDPTAHAEIVALREAGRNLRCWRLENCDLYVTIEPCVMCAGAVVWSRIRRLVFGARDAKAGAVASLYQIPQDERLNHRVEVVEGVLADECAAMMKEFFDRLRNGPVFERRLE
ncbi:MAG TPA: tRNA adenosine(34) deaminase TadA [bacterium]|nr:tRNA adenosine(34) deaminase TadA [bacterium]HQL63495.1 tRNA adenosine(34) deaminase TadA [bacterium]